MKQEQQHKCRHMKSTDYQTDDYRNALQPVGEAWTELNIFSKNGLIYRYIICALLQWELGEFRLTIFEGPQTLRDVDTPP